MVHEDGTVRWVLELARPIHDEHGDPWMIQGVIFDITDRKEAEESQIARSERLGSIIEIQRDIAADELAVDAVMRQICERAQELTHADSATVLTLDGDQLKVRAATGFLEDKVGDPDPRRRHASRLVVHARPVDDPRRRSGRPSSGRPRSRAGDAIGRRRPTPTARRVCRTADRDLTEARTSSRRTISKRWSSSRSCSPRHSATRPNPNRSASSSKRSLASRRCIRKRPSASR